MCHTPLSLTSDGNEIMTVSFIKSCKNKTYKAVYTVPDCKCIENDGFTDVEVKSHFIHLFRNMPALYSSACKISKLQRIC